MPELVIGPPDVVRPVVPPETSTLVTVPPASVGLALNTAAPAPAPSVTTITFEPLATFTVAPEPCLIVIIWLPVVAFSIIQTLDTVLGPNVTSLVAVRDTAEVIFK